jgi:glycosyltransferase involved in cell wall biosynthesis
MLDLTIIIVNKNYFRFLKKCINSCLSQSTNYRDEVILVDDGSNDGSVLYAKKIKDKKFFFIQTMSKGIEKAANAGFKKSKGKYVVRVDSDDYLDKNFVHNSLKEIKKSRKAFVYSNYILVDSKNNSRKKIILPQFNKKEILQRGDFLATGTVYNKNLIKKIGFYNDRIKNSGLENYELILKLVNKNYSGTKINKFLFYYRKHFKNLSIIKKKKISNYGSKLFKYMNLGKYSKNKYHPWN